jgi:hypothetical protein
MLRSHQLEIAPVESQDGRDLQTLRNPHDERIHKVKISVSIAVITAAEIVW